MLNCFLVGIVETTDYIFSKTVENKDTGTVDSVEISYVDV